MGEARIGPSSWRDGTKQEIKGSVANINKSDRNNEVGKAVDPLPVFRDTLADLSNNHSLRYMRDTRAVVAQLRETYLQTNEEIKAANRVKEAIEKALEHKRKDIMMCERSSEIRLSRPQRERPQDGADDLLHAEKHHLLNIKRSLETQLKAVQQQLQLLAVARKRLHTVIEERSLVLDFLCKATTSLIATPSKYLPPKRSEDPEILAAAKAGLIPPPGDPPEMPPTDPLSPYTPEAAQATTEAEEAMKKSKGLRMESRALIKQCEQLQRHVHVSVNDALTRKIAETVSLSQDLTVQAGENRHALNRAQNFNDVTERAFGIQLGPVAATDLFSKETLTRPLVNVFQRHPGTQLPEAQEIIQSGAGLLESLKETQHNIQQLEHTGERLRADLVDKESGANVDSAVVRLRRRNAPHRWVMPELR